MKFSDFTIKVNYGTIIALSVQSDETFLLKLVIVQDLNTQPTIRLVDANMNFIRMVNQVESFHLLRNNFCELLMVKPPTVQFLFEQWDELYLSKKYNKKYKFRKSKLYGNFHVQSPQGHEMFHCNSERALWYLNRNIAEIVPESARTIRLTFAPNGPGHIDDSYYLTEKINQCVVCGDNHCLNRHHVMPRVFRKYFPDVLKNHSYHDVLLLCISCHENYEKEASKLKIQICKEFELIPHNNQDYLPELGKSIKAAKTLLEHADKIPEDRKAFMMNIVCSYLNKQDVSMEDLEFLACQKAHVKTNVKNYGQCVAERLENIQEFTERWRKHFVETMNPKFLPDGWDIFKPVIADCHRKERTFND